MEILKPNTSWTIVDWQGRTYLVQTKVSPKSTKLCDDKPIFSIVQTSSTDLQSQGQLINDIFSQFSIPENFEIITWLNHYLNYYGLKLKYEDSAAAYQVKSESKQFTSSLIINAINQFRLLLRTEIPLTHSNLRLWFQYWQEPGLADKLGELCDYQDEIQELLPDKSYGLEIIQQLAVNSDVVSELNQPHEIPQWTYPQSVVLLQSVDSFQSVGSSQPADSVQPAASLQAAASLQSMALLQLADKLKALSKVLSFAQVNSDEKTSEKASEKTTQLMNLVINLSEQISIEKLLNSALKQSNLLSDPFYSQIPVFHDGKLFHVNILFFTEDGLKQRPSHKKPCFNLVVEIPTVNLGLIIANIRFKDDESTLAIIAAEYGVAEMIKANIDQIRQIGKVHFKSITVDFQEVKELRPKQRLLDIVFGQAKSSVDLRI